MRADWERLAAERVEESLEVQRGLLDPERVSTIAAAAGAIADCLRAGGKLIAFGNGGSAADAQHIAAELVGRYLLERRALPAISLSDNASILTAVGNDYAFADVFSRQVSALGAPGDVALAISTSGNSGNVLEAVAAARDAGLKTIGLTGEPGGGLREAVDICLAVPSGSTPRIQEGHTLLAHLLCELVERDLAADE